MEPVEVGPAVGVEPGVAHAATPGSAVSTVRPSRSGPAVLVCAECGHRQPFTRLPMFALTGPSGSGKSTVSRHLAAELGPAVVVVEQDVLWTSAFADPTDDFAQFRATWLRMIGMLGQNGRPVVFCGTVVPPQLEHLPERVFVGDISYLALVSDADALQARLRARPAWRGWDDEERIADTVRFTEWLRAHAATLDPPVALLDTTDAPLADTVAAVAAWVRRGLADAGLTP